jgi:hypothetical protein
MKAWMCKCDKGTSIRDDDRCGFAFCADSKDITGVFLPTPEYRALLGVVRKLKQFDNCKCNMGEVRKALAKYDKARGKK